MRKTPDTVNKRFTTQSVINLKGQGFTLRVKQGDRVKAGDELIDFDADYLIKHLIVGLYADQYAPEMHGQMAGA